MSKPKSKHRHRSLITSSVTVGKTPAAQASADNLLKALKSPGRFNIPTLNLSPNTNKKKASVEETKRKYQLAKYGNVYSQNASDLDRWQYHKQKEKHWVNQDDEPSDLRCPFRFVSSDNETSAQSSKTTTTTNSSPRHKNEEQLQRETTNFESLGRLNIRDTDEKISLSTLTSSGLDVSFTHFNSWTNKIINNLKQRGVNNIASVPEITPTPESIAIKKLLLSESINLSDPNILAQIQSLKDLENEVSKIFNNPDKDNSASQQSRKLIPIIPFSTLSDSQKLLDVSSSSQKPTKKEKKLKNSLKSESAKSGSKTPKRNSREHDEPLIRLNLKDHQTVTRRESLGDILSPKASIFSPKEKSSGSSTARKHKTKAKHKSHSFKILGHLKSTSGKVKSKHEEYPILLAGIPVESDGDDDISNFVLTPKAKVLSARQANNDQLLTTSTLHAGRARSMSFTKHTIISSESELEEGTASAPEEVCTKVQPKTTSKRQSYNSSVEDERTTIDVDDCSEDHSETNHSWVSFVNS